MKKVQILTACTTQQVNPLKGFPFNLVSSSMVYYSPNSSVQLFTSVPIGSGSAHVFIVTNYEKPTVCNDTKWCDTRHALCSVIASIIGPWGLTQRRLLLGTVYAARSNRVKMQLDGLLRAYANARGHVECGKIANAFCAPCAACPVV